MECRANMEIAPPPPPPASSPPFKKQAAWRLYTRMILYPSCCVCKRFRSRCWGEVFPHWDEIYQPDLLDAQLAWCKTWWMSIWSSLLFARRPRPAGYISMQQAVGPRRVHGGVRLSTVFSYAGQSTHSTPHELDNIRYVSYRAAYTVAGMALMWFGRRYIAGSATFLALHGLLLALIRRVLFHFGFGLYEIEINPRIAIPACSTGSLPITSPRCEFVPSPPSCKATATRVARKT
ncbi:hypothetical protein LY76DRAFT_319917 [Colletotrichum caudatum]|nr:hypothetical protein LY76DRAFT_319917 [Colletotrichum caudatum]